MAIDDRIAPELQITVDRFQTPGLGAVPQFQPAVDRGAVTDAGAVPDPDTAVDRTETAVAGVCVATHAHVAVHRDAVTRMGAAVSDLDILVQGMIAGRQRQRDHGRQRPAQSCPDTKVHP